MLICNNILLGAGVGKLLAKKQGKVSSKLVVADGPAGILIYLPVPRVGGFPVEWD
jgi:hypothetical protein